MKRPFIFSKYRGRKLSAFEAENMVGDYLSQHLDPERAKAFEVARKEFPRINELIASYESGQNYSRKLRQLKPSENLKKTILRPETFIDQTLERVQFSKWPKSFKMSLEILSVAALISIVSVLIPWEQLMSLKFGRRGDIVLAEINRQFDLSRDSGLPSLIVDTGAGSFPDESEDAESSTTTVLNTVVSTTSTTAPVKPMAVAAAKDTTKPTAAATGTTVAERRLGSLFRGSIQVINAKAAAQKITQRLSELGGRKAGEVEMGWEREKDLFYYHFTIPEDRYDQLSSLFSEFGSLRLVKERHERVMPEGIIRLIIVVEDKSRAQR
jgi:hypothetical protein